MAKMQLDPEQLSVASFDTSSAATAVMVAESDTNDEWCLAMTLLTEDCFGPSAGCTPGSETCESQQIQAN